MEIAAPKCNRRFFKMASKSTADDMLAAVFDDNFELSDGESSDEEGDGIYCNTV